MVATMMRTMMSRDAAYESCKYWLCYYLELMANLHVMAVSTSMLFFCLERLDDFHFLFLFSPPPIAYQCYECYFMCFLNSRLCNESKVASGSFGFTPTCFCYSGITATEAAWLNIIRRWVPIVPRRSNTAEQCQNGKE